MPKSQFAAALDEIQKPLTALLKNLGFRRKGRSYNRVVGDGLVHTVNLQMGQFPIGDYVIPGIRESFYGRFTVNLGIFLPAGRKLESDRDPPVFVQEYECEIRSRLGMLAFGEEIWWDLDLKVAETGASVVDLMDRFGLPFLDQFENYSTVLSHLERTGTLPSSNEGRSALAGALICCALGQVARATEFLERALAYGNEKRHKGFVEHVKSVRRQIKGDASETGGSAGYGDRSFCAAIADIRTGHWLGGRNDRHWTAPLQHLGCISRAGQSPHLLGDRNLWDCGNRWPSSLVRGIAADLGQEKIRRWPALALGAATGWPYVRPGTDPHVCQPSVFPFGGNRLLRIRRHYLLCAGQPAN
jgi:hypothetical protein